MHITGNLRLIFSDDKFPNDARKSIFLAGPSPRNATPRHWRNDCLDILSKFSQEQLDVYIPLWHEQFIDNVWQKDFGYDGQIQWEEGARDRADAIIFWVDREMKLMPAMTTNVEFGIDLLKARTFYARPNSAPKCRYLDWQASYNNLDTFDNLEMVSKQVLKWLADFPSVQRSGVDASIPLVIYCNPYFKDYLQNLRKNSHELVKLNMVSCYPQTHKQKPFLFVLKPHVQVARENRIKANEILVLRPDVSGLLAYHVPDDSQGVQDVQVVLVSEFRVASASSEGAFLLEIPSGSIEKNQSPVQAAVREFSEEVGVDLDNGEQAQSKAFLLSILRPAASLCTHRFYTYAMALTKSQWQEVQAKHVEFSEVKDMSGEKGIRVQNNEQTYTHCMSLSKAIELVQDSSVMAALLGLERKLKQGNT